MDTLEKREAFQRKRGADTKMFITALRTKTESSEQKNEFDIIKKSCDLNWQ